MNKSKIKVGMRVPNYPAFCDLLKEPVLEGNSKKYQIQEWGRNMKFSRDGHAFIIDEIYQMEKPKIDRRTLNAGKKIYRDHISIQILHCLANQHPSGSAWYVKNRRLFHELGLFNKKYRKYDDLADEIIAQFIEEYPNQFGKFDILKFYEYTGNKNKRIVNDALRDLKRRHIVDFDEIYQVTDMDGKSHYSSDDERKAINSIKYKILNDEFKCRYESDVHLKGLARVYYRRVNQEIRNQLGFQSAYKCYKIIFDESLLPEQIESMLKSADQICDEKHILNQKIRQNIVETAEKRYLEDKDAYEAWEKRLAALAKTVWGDISRRALIQMAAENNDPEPFVLHDDYPKNMKNLAEILIPLDFYG